YGARVQFVSLHCDAADGTLHSFPTRRSSALEGPRDRAAGRPVGRGRHRGRGTAPETGACPVRWRSRRSIEVRPGGAGVPACRGRSEEHTSELQSRENLVCRLLLEKKKKNKMK